MNVYDRFNQFADKTFDALLGHHNRSLTQHYALPDIQRLAQYVERVTVRNDAPVLR